jgi:hypothetical protein
MGAALRQGRHALVRGGRNRGGEKWERGRGFGRLRSPARERKGRLEKEKKLTYGPRLSAAGERGGGRGWPAGPTGPAGRK